MTFAWKPGLVKLSTWQLLHLSLSPFAVTNLFTMTNVIHSCAFSGSRGLPRIFATGLPVAGSVWQERHLSGEPSAVFSAFMRCIFIQLAISFFGVGFG